MSFQFYRLRSRPCAYFICVCGEVLLLFVVAEDQVSPACCYTISPFGVGRQKHRYRAAAVLRLYVDAYIRRYGTRRNSTPHGVN